MEQSLVQEHWAPLPSCSGLMFSALVIMTYSHAQNSNRCDIIRQKVMTMCFGDVLALEFLGPY